VRRLVVVLISSVFWSCGEDLVRPTSETAEVTADVSAALLASHGAATAGQWLRVAIDVDGAEAQRVAAVQGAVRFNAARLRYVGQVPAGGQVVVVDDSEAESGVLRLVSFGVDGFSGRAAVLEFAALGAWSAAAPEITFDAEAALPDGGVVSVWVDPVVRAEPTMGQRTPARRMSYSDWSRRLGFEHVGPAGVVSIDIAVPDAPTDSAALADASVGDCNVDGGVDVLDVLLVAHLSLRPALAPSDPDHVALCDVSADGAINVSDVLLVARLSVAVGTGGSTGGSTGGATGGSSRFFRAHEPGGMTRLTERPFSSLSEGWWWEFGKDDVSRATIVSDAGSPHSPSSVIQFNYPEGLDGGRGSNNRGIADFGGVYKTVYIYHTFKMDPTWQGHQSSGNKIWYIHHEDPPLRSGWSTFFFAQVIGDGPVRAAIEGQEHSEPTPFLRLLPNAGSASLVRDRWHELEFLLIANTPGQQNGTLKVWVDGVPSHEYSDVGYLREGGGEGFDRFQFDPIWGGIGDVKTSDQWLRVGHVYVSGSKRR